jgi:hypothetical protein
LNKKILLYFMLGIIVLLNVSFFVKAYANLNAAVLTVTQPAGNGDSAVTGAGFTPKVLIFFSCLTTTASSQMTNAYKMLGFATGTSSMRAVWGGARDNQATSNTSRANNESACIIFYTENGASPAIKGSAVLKSFDADGFTLTWANADGVQRKVFCLALGGTDITNATVKNIAPTSSTGNQSFTGVGFKPDALIYIGQTTAVGANYAVDKFNQEVGFADSSLNTGADAYSSANAANPTSARRYQRTNKFLEMLNSAADTSNEEATLVSLDSDGFTLNFTTGNTNGFYVLALKGARFKVGSFNQPASTGDQSVTGLGFQPSALILTSACTSSSTSIVTSSNTLSFGAGVSSSSRDCVWHGDISAVTPSKCDSDSNTSAIIRLLTAGTGSPALNAAADLKSMDSGGFTLTWSTVDSTPREIVYMGIGPAATAASSFDAFFLGGD